MDLVQCQFPIIYTSITSDTEFVEDLVRFALGINLLMFFLQDNGWLVPGFSAFHLFACSDEENVTHFPCRNNLKVHSKSETVKLRLGYIDENNTFSDWPSSLIIRVTQHCREL